MRRRLLQTPNVRLRGQCDALEPLSIAARGRVTGIRVHDRRGSNGTESMSADLVIDACGRGSPSPGWLTTLGYPNHGKRKLKSSVGYTTRLYRRQPEHLEHLHGKQFAILGCVQT